ncbi:hypothetical protein BKA57DRAFT_437797 [Linnemannia elongata]|nr:hypothetical protein BKA57DRAFT_437797 [Linnemannia elongata]
MSAETPADRIKGLHAVMKMLLQSPSLERPVDAYYVERVCKGITPTAPECTTVATLVNILRPFVPKRQLPKSSSDSKTKENIGGYTFKAEAHVALRAPFLVLANEFFRVAGYSGSMRQLAPQVSPSSRHALALTRSSLSEILFSSKENQFDYYDDNLKVIRNRPTIQQKARIFFSIFNRHAIDELCKQYQMEFAFRFLIFSFHFLDIRLIYIDKLRVRIIGTTIGHGQQGRLDHPVVSLFDVGRKAKKKRRSPAAIDWIQEVRTMNADTELVEKEYAKVESELEEAMVTLKLLRSELEPLRQDKVESARKKRQISRARRLGDKSDTLLDQMSAAREDFRHKSDAYHSKLQPTLEAEKEVRTLRSYRYYWMRLQHFTKETKPDPEAQQDAPAQPPNARRDPSWERPEHEDYAEYINLDHLKPRDPRTVTLGSFDPGIAKMLQASRMSLHDVAARLNIYQLLQDENAVNDGEDTDMLDHDGQDSTKAECSDRQYHNNNTTEDKPEDTDAIVHHHSSTIQVPQPPLAISVPPAITTTANQVNHLSYMNKAAKRRNKRLTPEWKAAHQELSKNSITHLLSFTELDEAQNKRMSTGPALRNFERNETILKDRRTRELLTKRTYAGLASRQRHFFQNAGKKNVYF